MQVSTGDLAAILGLTGRRIQQLENARVFLRIAHGEWDLPQAVQAYVEYRVKAKPRTPGAGGRAEEKLIAMKADREELKLAVDRGRLIDAEEAVALADELVGAVRTGFGGLPARVTRDLALRQKIETEINDILGRVAGQLEQRAADIEARRRDAAPAETAAPGRVGLGEPNLPGEFW